MKRLLTVAALLSACALSGSILTLGCAGLSTTDFYEQGVAVSASPIASQIGVDIMRDGGNAFDAAVAVGFALAVTYPQAGNIGGGGFALLREGESKSISSLDFRETAPSGATPTMYLDDSGTVIQDRSTFGVLSAAVPGTVAGLHELWKKHGSLPWSTLVTAAARLADTGFVVNEHLAQAFAEHRKDMINSPTTAATFYAGGQSPQAGDRLILKDLAGTLYAIASDGPEAFYRGVVAERIVASQLAAGGLITAEDLAAYSPIWRQPLHFTFDSLDIYSMAPPSSGGIVVGQILKLLEPYEFSQYSPGTPEYMHLFCEAARRAFADRAEHLGDPSFWDIPVEGLLDRQYLEERRSTISLREVSHSSAIQPGHPRKYESDQTTHYSVCDAHGNIVAITTTLNSVFGSMLVVDGAGFLLNNEMDDFSIKAGYPNQFGLVGSEANKIEPGKRMLSSMSPTIVLLKDRPLLVLGAPGGSRIITTVAQAIINFTRFHLSLRETVAQPRFHHQWLPDTLFVEQQSYPAETVRQLETYGHTVAERSRYSDLQMIWINPTGLMAGASDPRGAGAPAGY